MRKSRKAKAHPRATAQAVDEGENPTQLSDSFDAEGGELPPAPVPVYMVAERAMILEFLEGFEREFRLFTGDDEQNAASIHTKLGKSPE
ncbi:hypothetical protein [Microbulbifer magnicolonia]|uniref:hypothetical protein n=1 Tax=Microbulbifer magnicolonia TaxID=3109744 RepID=UPI002B408A08|nr:hypothetical protein [Microbulbifer sp. GG15]